MAELVRVSRDGNLFVVKIGETYHQIAGMLSQGAAVSVNTDGAPHPFESLSSATSSGKWRRPTAAEKGRVTFMTNKSKKTYRVPPAVQENAKNALSSGAPISEPLDLVHISALASGNPVSSDTIEWMQTNFSSLETKKTTFGGDAGKAWASKFSLKAITAAGFVADDAMEYYAAGKDEANPANVDVLLGVDEADNLYTWIEGDWFALPDSVDDYDAPSILEISDEDATAFAAWIDTPDKTEEFFILTDINPEERNLVDLAFSEIDWEEIDRLQSLTADATGYSPAERSDNATRQQRSMDGRFGGPQAEKSKTFAAPRARLTEELPLILDPAARIEEHFGNPPAQDEPQEEPVVAAGEEPVAPEAPAEEAPADEQPSGENPLYFAIVDPVDTTAVLDIVSIGANSEGQQEAWTRTNGEWVANDQMLADLKGDTPPAVVELESEDLVKNVLTQIDSYDAETVQPAEESPDAIAASAYELTDYSKKQRENDAKKGLALADGSYPIRNVGDLKNAVQAFGRAPDSKRSEVKRHIKKRAKALNRTDLVPSEWKESSVFDDAHLSPLYGEYGEVIAMVAAGGNAETLRQYWAYGEGAAKIRWGTEGDLSRCARQLGKYMPGRSWGYCQNLHQRIFGMSNAKRDKAVGQ